MSANDTVKSTTSQESESQFTLDQNLLKLLDSVVNSSTSRNKEMQAQLRGYARFGSDS